MALPNGEVFFEVAVSEEQLGSLPNKFTAADHKAVSDALKAKIKYELDPTLVSINWNQLSDLPVGKANNGYLDEAEARDYLKNTKICQLAPGVTLGALAAVRDNKNDRSNCPRPVFQVMKNGNNVTITVTLSNQDSTEIVLPVRISLDWNVKFDWAQVTGA